MNILIISPEQSYITQRLCEEATKADVQLETVSIQELADRHFDVDVNKYDCLYIRFCYPYFPQTIELAKRFVAAGKKVVDADIANGNVGEGKMVVYQELLKAGLPIPRTEWLEEVREWEYPSIVKWKYGFGGKEVFLIHNPADLKKATDLIPVEELMLQEFVPADFEYKVVTVGYKSLPVILRFEINKQIWRPDFGKTSVLTIPSEPESDHYQPGESRDLLIEGKQTPPFRPVDDNLITDVSRGGDIAKVVSLAEQSSKLLKRELAKVDILQKDDKFYILEVNRWPGLKSFEQLTGYNAVGEFIKYLVRK